MSRSAVSSSWFARVLARVVRTRLRTRITGTILVPLVPLALLSYADLRRLDGEAKTASGASERIERSMPLHRLISDLALEEMLSTARVKQSLADVSDDLVKRQTGLDLNALLAQTRSTVDHDLDMIAGTLPLPTEPLNLVARVINLRPAIDRKSAMLDQIQREFDTATASIEIVAQDDFDAITAALGNLPRATVLIKQYQLTQQIFDVMRLQAHEVLAYSTFVIPTLSSGNDALDFAAALGNKRDAWTKIDATLTPAKDSNWAQLTQSPAVQAVARTESTILARMGLTAGTPAATSDVAPEFVTGSAQLINDMSTFAVTQAQTLMASSHSAIDESQAQFRLAVLRSVLLALLTAGLVVVTVRTIVVPLRRVEARARAVSRGELDSEPLPSRGPVEIIVVTEAMNDLSVNLNRLVTQFSALSGGHGDTGSASMRSHLQPAQSLHEKIDHLDAMAQRMRQDEMRAKAIVEHAGNAIFTVDPEGLLRQVNAAGARLLGYDANALIGTSIRRHILGELVSGENRIYQIGAPDITVELSVSPVEGTNMLTVVARDITLDKKREAQLAHAARHDALTGLANRVALMEELDAGSNDGRPATLFFLDLDGFKAVNDTWGHAVGDELLVAVSRRLVSMLREGDLAARYGGDEFVAIVYGLPDNSSAIRFGKRLIETIEVPFQLGQRNVTISTSVGVVRRTENATAQELLHRADIAAYGAKAAGKGNVRIHDPERAAWLRGRKSH